MSGREYRNYDEAIVTVTIELRHHRMGDSPPESTIYSRSTVNPLNATGRAGQRQHIRTVVAREVQSFLDNGIPETKVPDGR